MKKIIIALILITYANVAGAKLYVHGDMGVKVTCLPEFDFYSLEPLKIYTVSFQLITRNNKNNEITNELELEKLKKKGVYINLSTSKNRKEDKYIKQTNICHLPSGEIKTEMKISPSMFQMLYDNLESAESEINIHFNNKLMMTSSFYVVSGSPFIKSISYENELFTINNNSDWRSNEILIRFRPILIDAINSTIGRICDKDLDFRKIKFPLTKETLKEIGHTCERDKNLHRVGPDNFKTNKEFYQHFNLYEEQKNLNFPKLSNKEIELLKQDTDKFYFNWCK